MDTHAIKTQLEQKKQELQEDLALLEKSDPSSDKFRSLSNSPEDDSDEAERGNRTEAIRSVQEKQLNYVMTALQKLENGTYGICDLTGEKIDEERLRAIPWAIYTKEAEEQLEQRAQNA